MSAMRSVPWGAEYRRGYTTFGEPGGRGSGDAQGGRGRLGRGMKGHVGDEAGPTGRLYRAGGAWPEGAGAAAAVEEAGAAGGTGRSSRGRWGAGSGESGSKAAAPGRAGASESVRGRWEAGSGESDLGRGWPGGATMSGGAWGTAQGAGFEIPAPEFEGSDEFEDRFMKPGEDEVVVGQLFPGGLVVVEDIVGM